MRRRRQGNKRGSAGGRRAATDGVSVPGVAPGGPAPAAIRTVAPPAEPVRFETLDLPDEIMRAIRDLGFEICTPIQAGILPYLLEGRDAGGRAQTGTGKTAAFLIGIFNRWLKAPDSQPRRNGTPRALIMAPTRELVVQIERDARLLGKYCGMEMLAVYGGLDYEKQQRILREQRVDLIVATPGRLLDYLGRRVVHLNHVEILVLDEADRMLDMGFIPDVRRIIHATPPRRERQTLLFSATLTPEVTRLASQWMRDPLFVECAPEEVAAAGVEQVVYIVTRNQKIDLLHNLLVQEKPERVILFVNRRVTAERLLERIQTLGMKSALLSGSVPQNKRMRTLDAFRAGDIQILVATDVAGRGLHIEGISHIVNFNVPLDPEDYVHRIGRTGRAGALGRAITFACEEESFYLPGIEAYLGKPLVYLHPEPELLKPSPTRAAGGTPRGRRSRRKRPGARRERKS